MNYRPNFIVKFFLYLALIFDWKHRNCNSFIKYDKNKWTITHIDVFKPEWDDDDLRIA